MRNVLVAVITLVSLILMFGCIGMEKAPEHRTPGYLYYPKVLVDADKALDEARQKGKDKECPKEFNEAKARVDKAYEDYMKCITPASLPVNVVCPPPPPPACELRSDKEKITLGESVTLTMTTSGKITSAELEGTTVELTGGTKKIAPSAATRFTAKVVGPGGTTTCSVPVSVRLVLYVHFPFDRPKAGEDAKWFKNPDADNPEDLKDPSRTERKTPFMNTQLKDNPAELKKAVEFVKNNPGALITVTGHTDSIEKKPGYNQALSDRRANAVKEYLIDQRVVDRAKIRSKGLGAKEPVAPEKTSDGKDDPEGRAKNRRVEIISEAASLK
jgi:OOP family OmpA-OmpF porin